MPPNAAIFAPPHINDITIIIHQHKITEMSNGMAVAATMQFGNQADPKIRDLRAALLGCGGEGVLPQLMERLSAQKFIHQNVPYAATRGEMQLRRFDF